MPDILLATLNARYIHAAFGLRYLLANLGELRPRAALAEFDINQRPLEIVEAIVARGKQGSVENRWGNRGQGSKVD